MKILITGSNGMVGRDLIEKLKSQPCELLVPKREELDLVNEKAVYDYLSRNSINLVIHLAAKVGGIQANINNPIEFITDNLRININVIYGSYLTGIKKFINMGSSCMYPKDLSRNLKEKDILTGVLEPTNEGYAIAKIAGMKLCNYISSQTGYLYKTIIPCNLYGPYDKFGEVESHLIPAIIRKIHSAIINHEPTVEIWGDGKAKREFMYVGNLVDFIIFVKDNLENIPNIINCGIGYDHSVNEYYEIAAKVMGYKGKFKHNLEKPAGMQRKVLDVTRANSLKWQSKVSLEEGLIKTYEYYKKICGGSQI